LQVRDNLKPQLRWGLAKKILLIDPEIWSRDGMAADLSFEGCEVTAVRSALEAIQTLSEERFDLVIVELAFPEPNAHFAGTAWDDFLVLEWLHRTGAPPFVAISSEGDKFRSQCLENGAREFLQKPIAPELLLQAVEQAGVCVGSVSIK
jgi:CheY-like chemotaxis protein